ncbi:methyltransferase domain-containing protein (plasmid) [Natrinema halophilum]|nr:methyltransferase domain-containing protein [Natrinema halophilum]
MGLEIELRSAGAESLPYEDDSFDVVITSMVFCTIPDIEATLSEVARVLRPGGEFRFFEHVLDDGWRARIQSRIAPLWKRAAGECYLTRQIASVFTADRSFDVVKVDRMNLGVAPIRPFVRGRLRKRA